MKSIMRYIPVLVSLMLLAVSCETVIEFRGEKIDPKIVIYSLLQPDSVITVSIAESHAVFEEKYEPQQITDAVVKLYCDGELVETLTYVAPAPQPGGYTPPDYSKYASQGIKPVHGSVYRIEVEMAGLKTAFGEASLPDLVSIIGIDTTEDKETEGNIMLLTRVRFSDPAERNNFYRMTAWRLDGSYNGNKEEPWSPEIPVTIYESDCSYASGNDPVINPQQQEEEDLFGISVQNSYHIFGDELIAGKTYDLTLEMNHRWPDTDYYEFSQFNFELQSITEDLYLYLRSTAAHIQTGDNYITEPVLVYTNIENGLGVVGAMSPSKATLRIGEYPVAGVTYEVSRW